MIPITSCDSNYLVVEVDSLVLLSCVVNFHHLVVLANGSTYWRLSSVLHMVVVSAVVRGVIQLILDF